MSTLLRGSSSSSPTSTSTTAALGASSRRGGGCCAGCGRRRLLLCSGAAAGAPRWRPGAAAAGRGRPVRATRGKAAMPGGNKTSSASCGAWNACFSGLFGQSDGSVRVQPGGGLSVINVSSRERRLVNGLRQALAFLSSACFVPRHSRLQAQEGSCLQQLEPRHDIRVEHYLLGQQSSSLSPCTRLRSSAPASSRVREPPSVAPSQVPNCARHRACAAEDGRKTHCSELPLASTHANVPAPSGPCSSSQGPPPAAAAAAPAAPPSWVPDSTRPVWP